MALRYYFKQDKVKQTLSPGKIEGWVILETAGGAVTHTVGKDENGNIILIPVNGEE